MLSMLIMVYSWWLENPLQCSTYPSWSQWCGSHLSSSLQLRAPCTSVHQNRDMWKVVQLNDKSEKNLHHMWPDSHPEQPEIAVCSSLSLSPFLWPGRIRAATQLHTACACKLCACTHWSSVSLYEAQRVECIIALSGFHFESFTQKHSL